MRVQFRVPALAALSAASVFAVPAVLAAEPVVDELETIVVTATRGRTSTPLDTPVPIDVVDASQIATAGGFGGELGQTLQTLVPSFNMPRQSNSGSGDLVRPAQLRGMSPDQVLVLINGKRRHTTSVTGIDTKIGRGTAPVDFNSIPSNAIKRIEVLRDGAGAQYGSDAIAGVVNVILDDRPEGIDFALSYGEHMTDFDPTDDSIEDGGTTTFQGTAGLPLGEDGFLRAGFDYRDRDDTNRAGFDLVPFFEDEANIDLVGGQRNFRPGDAKTEDLNLWLNTEFALGGLTAYGFATYNDRSAEGTGFFRYPVGSANLQEVYPLGYRPITLGDNEDLSLAGGLRGVFQEWQWDGSVSWGRNQFDSGVRNSLNPSLGVTSPTRFRSGSFENELLSLNLDTSRSLDLAEAATLALGLEWRQENFTSRAGEPASYAAGPLADSFEIGAQAGGGLRPEEARDLDRDVASVYGELTVDLTETLLLDVAARFEDFSDFGSAVNGKIAARWEFVPDYAARASVSTSLRAPSLVQLGYGNSSTSFGEGGQLTTVNTLTVDDPLAQALGARELDEESSVNFSIGLTGRITDELQFTLDAFRIDVDDRITLSERIDCFAGNVPDAALAQCESRNITAANFFTNAVNTRTDGIEATLAYATDLAGGTLGVNFGYAYADTEIRSVNDPAVAGVVLVGVEETNTIEGAAPDDKGSLSGTWQGERLSLLARVNYYGETTRVFNFGDGFEPEQTYGSRFQFDTEVGYKVFGDVELFVGASNLFDEYPEKSDSLINYFDNLPYDVLSPIGFNGRFVYGGVRASF
jgi:iron complex outermembrane receptor protein